MTSVGIHIKAVDTLEGAKSDNDDARRAARVTCGADIIIKNVLPFLNDGDVFSLLNYKPSGRIIN